MRTKTLLLSAVLGAAGIASSLAQVYSVNVVGYVNLAIPPRFSMIANPLNNTAPNGNTLSNLFPSVPNGSAIFKFNDATKLFVGSSYFFGWSDPNMTLAPGEGAFFNNASTTAFTNTFVGEVMQGSLSNPIPQGYSIKSSQVPQGGQLDTDLGFPAANGDSVFLFDPASQLYVGYSYFFGWNSPPLVAVAQSFFVNKVAAVPWNRSFTP